MFRRQITVLVFGGLLAVLLPPNGGSAASLSDPTRPPQRFIAPVVSAPVVPKSWKLGAILIAPQRRVAVINGQPLSVGDQVSGAKVIDIESDRVRLRRGSREFVLDLLPKRPTVTAVAEQE